MRKHNLLSKQLKKQFLSINNTLESYFNSFKSFKSNFKKIKLTTNNRVFLAIGALIILTLSYFLLPTIYNKNLIKLEIKIQIKKKYNIDLKFDESIKYGLLPRPHFSAKNSRIFNNGNEIANVENFKIFVSFKNFLNINKVELKDLIFQKADFNVYKEDLIFFQKLLTIEPNENQIIFKNSNLFFKNNDEILFINKIFQSKFFYDSKNLENILYSKNEIFNLPFKITIRNDKFNKKILVKFNSKKVRLNLDSEIDYSEKNINGILDLLFVSKSTLLNYEVKKNSFNFQSDDLKYKYDGKIDFKPFYFYANFEYEGLSLKNLFKEDTILVDIIKSEILKNKNLNAKIDLNIKNITNVDELKDLNLDIGIDEGDIVLSNSKIKWKDDVEISLTESLLNFDKYQINLVGKIILKFKNLDNFYKSFQIKKKNRKKINEVKLDFVYNFTQETISFDNAKVDNNSSEKLNRYINDFNLNDKRIFNKITLKNFINNFFNAYAG